MFHTGDLNSGINKALVESKLVACFVTNGDEESRLWEDDFLQDPELSSQLQDRTVLLRLNAGSEEANYLAAIFPIPKVPTLIAIWNGELKEYLAAGIAKEEFLARLGKALESVSGRSNIEKDRRPIASNGTGNSQNSQQRTTEGQDQNSSDGPSASDPNAESISTLRPTHNNATGPSSSGSLPIDPRSNLPEDAKAIVEQPSQRGDTTSYAAIQKRRQQEAREERARILALVESDKARRRNDAARKSNHGDQLTEQSTPPHEKGSSSGPASAPKAQDCALQIRLFDGSSIRSRFSKASTLNGEVRKWIDGHQKDDAPYVFKHVCTPLPNKTLSISDENRDLESLGLHPSATLIIVPVQGYNSAYEASESSGMLSRGIAAGFGLGTWGINRVFTTLSGIVGGPAVASNTDQRAEPSTSAASSRASNLRTLRDQHDGDDRHELYNGNTLNFEPRKDDHDGEL
ncbi:hypothetical protein DSL72_000630 [Monilinia vaccinii-corymbosi]|uniref:UBX domain-containing protein 2 n=1 Tax=Monilinia vaccinii-corymbosi TaxID=61207 RepID=A0A8A3P9N8_9HELO|nr:hypothetical protein DSL72_000630 [Monilinia vaccinii-corymbosi]